MTSKLIAGAAVFCATFGVGTAAPAATSTNTDGTPHLRKVEMLEVTLPWGLCEFDQRLPANLIAILRDRSDHYRLLAYMLENCPDLALDLADAATASLPAAAATGSDRSGGAAANGATAGSGTPGGGASNRPSDSDGDGNNGHGDNEGRNDPSNPGRGKK